ncbi:MAG TPA: prepilin-type N-terminal cleavage/methylation domain-containing protein [Syntrophobacteria bacterium]|nr:prepilin-type N-terminal cleavage/methylation domain-containing protein [Syntrophobacteria bacterium]
MTCERYPWHSGDVRGFTFVELLVVIAILGVLTAIAMKAYTDDRARSYDTQAVSFMRNLLTAAETDAPRLGLPQTYLGEQHLTEYPQLQLNKGMKLVIDQDSDNRIRFFVAHRAGDVGFYFWIPGPGCAAQMDDDIVTDQLGTVKPTPSDKIVPDMATVTQYDWTVFRNLVNP